MADVKRRERMEVSGGSKEDFDDLRIPMRYRAPLISNPLPPKTTAAAVILRMAQRLRALLTFGPSLRRMSA